MTDPKHAHDTPNGRYYTRPESGEQLVSVTNVLSTGFAKFGLPRWYANNAADYALDNLPHVVTQARAHRDEIRKEIAEAAERARDGAANLGTRVHALAEAHITGQQLAEQEGDDEAGLYVAQYLKFLDDFGIDVERDFVSAELTVANPERGYAGTADAIVRLPLDGYIEGQPVKALPDGQRAPWLIDLKTSRKRASTQTYPDHALQLAALRHAKEMWLPDDSIQKMFRPIVGCAILNLRPKTYKLIPKATRVDKELATFHHILASCQWLHNDAAGEYDDRPIKPDGKREAKRATRKKEAA